MSADKDVSAVVDTILEVVSPNRIHCVAVSWFIMYSLSLSAKLFVQSFFKPKKYYCIIEILNYR